MLRRLKEASDISCNAREQMDRTIEWIAAIENCCIKLQLAPDKVTLVKSSLVLRPTRKPSQFAQVSNAVASAIKDLYDLIQSHSKGYLSSYSNSERDTIEAEVSMLVKTCSQHIDKLKDSILRTQQKQEASSSQVLNGQTVAHLHGTVLVLAESLQRAASTFDSLRAQRYKQKAKEEEARRLAAQQGTGQSNAFSSGLATFLGSKMQQITMTADNQALVSQLTRSTNNVQGIEKTAIELAQLGQLLSTAISSQALAIEEIYENALESSAYVAAGNEHLKEAIKLNRSYQRYVIVLVLVATASLLFFDWFNS